jgi:hypothetical protein
LPFFTTTQTDGDSYPSIWYTPTGKELGEALWEETLHEFEPFGMAKIIEDLKKTEYGAEGGQQT